MSEYESLQPLRRLKISQLPDISPDTGNWSDYQCTDQIYELRQTRRDKSQGDYVCHVVFCDNLTGGLKHKELEENIFLFSTDYVYEGDFGQALKVFFYTKLEPRVNMPREDWPEI
jgi:hypothetical protein